MTPTTPHAPAIRAALVAILTLALALCAWFTASGARAAQAEWGLSILPEACAQGERVLLSEIAKPFGDLPGAHWRKLGATPLWAAPRREGRAEALPKAELAARLREHLGDLARLCVLPSGGMTVRRGGGLVTREDMENRIRQALAPTLATMDGRAEIADLDLPRRLFIDTPFSKLEIQPTAPLKAGRNSLRLVAKAADGQAVGQTTAQVFVNVWRVVACASRPVNSGETVGPEQLLFKTKNVAHLPGEPWDGHGGPWRVKRPVGTEQPLYRHNLEPVPVVGRGELVTLTYTGRHVRLSVQVEALQDGGVGEAINVRNRQSGRTLTAFVVGAGAVQVQ